MRLTQELCLQHGENISCTWCEASKKKVQITDKFLDAIFVDIKEGSEEFVVGTLARCVVCRTVKKQPLEDMIRSFSTASVDTQEIVAR